MKSFIDLDKTFSSQPRQVSVLLSTIDGGRGKEDLFRDQRPRLLERLSEGARVESITASNAIEGINVAEGRAKALADGRMTFRNRTEQEFAGYRDALDELIQRAPEPISFALLMHIHRKLLQHVDGRGGFLKSEPNQIISRQSGRAEIVYVPPAPEECEFLLTELIDRYVRAQKDRAAHPVLLVAALALDLLSIHPFADGNGRTTRLATNSELLESGYGVVRYVSLEQRIFESKNQYYANLYQSQRNWVETDGEHNIWPWAEYFISILATAYSDFESRIAAAGSMDGLSKQEQVEHWVMNQAPAQFSRADLEAALPWVSPATIMLVLNVLRADGHIEVGRGRSARWRRRQKLGS
ncbi:MAG: Fic family protein [Solirubrobacterales bacterium]|nr:Fic family protein [Solirubrobacterales bacterium]